MSQEDISLHIDSLALEYEIIINFHQLYQIWTQTISEKDKGILQLIMTMYEIFE